MGRAERYFPVETRTRDSMTAAADADRCTATFPFNSFKVFLYFKHQNAVVFLIQGRLLNIQGTYRFKSGACFIGDYYNNIKQGQGTLYYPDGSKYEGSWVEDLRQGHGIYTYPNGDKYDGAWLRDVRHGQGTYWYNDTGSSYRGAWNNGKIDAVGEILHSNHHYKGSFLNNNPTGPGKYVFDIGCEQHGDYILTEQTGPPEDDEGDSSSALKWLPRDITGPTMGTSVSTKPSSGGP
ncbi:radial spoke head 1 homolog isoform X3 [Gadus morhua]|uniref:radial spoke head 1 homolog isoform X3 n=1 Tax=Gadus morhua TaxID=8049 RepID=UPI0011B3CEA8|nr:radial spoke head 1 homolog isoform X3 [Gadus morhua]